MKIMLQKIKKIRIVALAVLITGILTAFNDQVNFEIIKKPRYLLFTIQRIECVLC